MKYELYSAGSLCYFTNSTQKDAKLY